MEKRTSARHKSGVPSRNKDRSEDDSQVVERMKEEHISIAEFAKRAGVSRQTIYKRMSGDLSTFVVTVNGAKRLKTQALSLFDVNQTDNLVYSLELVLSLKRYVEVLEKELEFKSKIITAQIEQIKESSDRIEEYSKRLAESHVLLDQQQKLHAVAEVDRQHRIEENSTPPKKETGFFQRLFRKE